jgi:hypothetical protein
MQLGEQPVSLPTGEERARVSAWLHEFGAVTVFIETRLRCDVEQLPALTAGLSSERRLEEDARNALAQLANRLRPAIDRLGGLGPVEDYFILQIDELEPKASIQELLEKHGPAIASALRCEADRLSATEVSDALQTARSYYPHDLVVTDWNVALILDRDYRDAVAILEFLNVQLVELRFYDALLDRRVASVERLETFSPRRFSLAYRRHHRAIDEIARIRIDMATIFERIHNALKLGGDVYLAQIYALTAKRLGLEAWELSVARKLEVLQNIHDVLVERAATARAEALELTIILLILVEIVLSLVGG